MKIQEERLVKEINIALDSPGKWKKNKVQRILNAVAKEISIQKQELLEEVEKKLKKEYESVDIFHWWHIEQVLKKIK